MIRVNTQPLFDALCPEWVRPPETVPERRVRVLVERRDGLYRPGEPVTFYAGLTDRAGNCISGIGLKCLLERDFHEPVEFPLVTRDHPVEVTTELEKPGFIRLSASCDDLSAAAGAGVAPLEIEPVPDIPGFDAFWAERRAELAAVSPDVLLCEELAPALPEYAGLVRCFDVRVACAGGRPVSGILAVPRRIPAEGCPGYLFFHGAGVRGAFQPLTWAAHGMIAFNVNALGLENNRPPEFYRTLAEGELRNYECRPVAAPEESPFCGMFLRVLRALEFLKSRPEWDGRHLVVHGGSQGGLQALAAAGMDHDVSLLVANAPAMCNQLAALEGRTPSWPFQIRPDSAYPEAALTAPFFDGVSFARRAVAAGYFTVAFSDVAAVPSSVYAAYNAYGGNKEIMDFVDCGHDGPVFWSAEAEIFEHVRQSETEVGAK